MKNNHMNNDQNSTQLTVPASYLVAQNKSKYSEAMRKNADTEALQYQAGAVNAEIVTDYHFTEREKEILATRSAHRSPQRYPLFLRGYTDTVAINALLTDRNGCSPASADIDFSNIGKIGEQGYTFDYDYVAKFALKYYAKADNDFSVPRSLEQAIQRVAAAFVQEIGRLDPLSWEEAVAVVCSKDTAAWNLGGSKSDASVREWLMKHEPGEITQCSTLLGQRYQRNKQTDDGYPVPRCIFNDHVYTVTEAAMYEHPLVRAIQKSRLSDSVYAELHGPSKVGEAIARWNASGSNVGFDSAEVDVRGMDQCFNFRHYEKIVKPILHAVFPEESWDHMDATVKHCFISDLVVKDTLVIRGNHTVFSGVRWVHILEGIFTHVMEEWWTSLLALASTNDDGEFVKIVPLTEYKDTLKAECGDDSYVLIARPTSLHYVTKLDGRWTTVSCMDVARKCYEHVGMEVPEHKCVVRRNAVSFCNKYYSSRAVVLDSDGSIRAYRPVYSPTLALNGVLHPESVVVGGDMFTEIARVASIVDQSFGSEHFNKLCTLLINSIDPADRAVLEKTVDSLFDEVDAASKRLGIAASWSARCEEWDCSHSPFLIELARSLGMTTEERLAQAKLNADALRIKRIHWKYRIDPTAVTDGIDPAGKRYLSFFTELMGKGGVITPDYEALAFGISHDILGSPATVRSEEEYDVAQTFSSNLALDTPLTERVGAKKQVHSQVIKDSSGPKVTVDFDVDF